MIRLTGTMAAVLGVCSDERAVTAREIVAALDFRERTVREAVSDLLDMGALRRVGTINVRGGHATLYKLASTAPRAERDRSLDPIVWPQHPPRNSAPLRAVPFTGGLNPFGEVEPW